MIFKLPKFRMVGDTGILVQVGDNIDRETNVLVHNLVHAIELDRPAGLIEVIPAYNSLLINYDPLTSSIDDWIQMVDSNFTAPQPYILNVPRLIEIPVCYGEDFGPDMEFVAELNGLSIEDVMEIHSSVDYFVYMLGFTPGFAYLGGMDHRLFAPRLDTPRDMVFEGSVGIANTQTGIYPVSSPGGWRLIARTPLKLFTPDSELPFRYRAGDLIRFRPIDRNEFESISRSNA